MSVFAKMSTTLVLLSALVGLLTYIFWKLRKHFKYWHSLGIPCEEPHWIMGSVKDMQTKHSMNQVCLNYYRKFRGTGPFAGFYWFPIKGVFVLDTSLVKNILIKDFANFTDHSFSPNEQDDPLSGQLFLLEGQKWRNMRNKLTPAFTSGKMKHMFPTVIRIGEQFVNVFGEMAKEKEDSVLEVKELLARFSTDVIGTCAFGIDCNSLKDPEAEFRVMGKKAIAEPFRHGILLTGFMMAFPKLAKKFHMKMTPEDIEKFYMRIVRETVEHREKNNIRRNDFMDQLIDLKNNKLIKSEHGDELSNLTLEQITAQAFVFFNAGFETSSTTMGFALYELAQNEDIQQRAREEIESVLEAHNQEFTYECMKELVYLDQIISETLRLYTVLPMLSRVCLEDYVVPDHPNYVIKKGMPIMIPAAAIHRDEKYYPNPEVFNPDHFTPEMVKQRDSVEWLPFGDGPRNCVGMRFGQMQTRIGLAVLLKNFKLSVCPKTQIPMKYNKKSFMLCSEEGIYLKVEKL